MKLSSDIKHEVIQKLNALLDAKILDAKTAIEDLLSSRESETKSSAGDKYETAREMLQIEIGKYQGQMDINKRLKSAIAQIDPLQKHSVVSFGSMVKTTLGIYMISVGLGPIQFNDTKFFAISLASPIGKLLQGCKKGEKISFQNKQIEILEIQ
jgi:transcription elongation GreA/GreB family factor